MQRLVDACILNMLIILAVKTYKSHNAISIFFIPRILSTAFHKFTCKLRWQCSCEVAMTIYLWSCHDNARVQLLWQCSCCSNSFTYKSNCWSSCYIAGFFALEKSRQLHQLLWLLENVPRFYTVPFLFCIGNIYLWTSLQFLKSLKIH